MALSPDNRMQVPSEESAAAAFARRFAWWIILLVFTSLIVNLADIERFSAGQYTDVQVSLPLRLLREGVYLLILADFGLLILRCRSARWFSYRALLLWFAISIYVATEAMYSAAIGLPSIVILAGVRMFEYVPLMFVAATVYRIAGTAPFRTIARAFVIYLIIESLAGGIEITMLPTIFGARTRAYGTLPSPATFGIAIAVCLLFAIAARLRPLWPVFLLAAVMSIASGTRTAILMVMGLAAYIVFDRVRELRLRMALGLIGIIASPFLFGLSNSEILTGRYGTSSGVAPRLNEWGIILGKIHSVPDLLFGWGMGLGSNTVFSLLGEYGYPGQYVADGLIPLIIGSYGLNGVLIELALMAVYFWRVRHDFAAQTAGAMFLLASIADIILEVFPANAMFFVIMGWLWAANWNPSTLRVPKPLLQQAAA